MASHLIGVLGLKRSGKDTFASRLVDEWGFTRVAFADPLKEAALGLDPIIRVEHDEIGPLAEAMGFSMPWGYYRLAYLVEHAGWEAAKEVREVRRTLQELGVSIRAIDEEFWLNAAKRRVEEIHGPAVITDVRLPNEVEYVERCGVTVRVHRPGLEAADGHVSETALADYEARWTAVNDGTIADLHVMADELVRFERLTR